MKLTVNKNQLREAPELFLRRAGYVYITDRRSGHDSFVRRLTRNYYPRLHLYVQETDDHRHGGAGKVIFNLHLDQKRPSYAGAPAHNAEYEGEVVQAEIKRLKKLIVE